MADGRHYKNPPPIPYSPATDATPRDSDLDPHAGCREREAALRRALAAADAMAEQSVDAWGEPSLQFMGLTDWSVQCKFCGSGRQSVNGPLPRTAEFRHGANCPLAAYQAARKEVTP